ncbi:hypothetical protein A374_19190 [Fictibacillus macauensis ZFHKF-1]|uniref:SLAP domain-containing protein n=1 Tax=Fictibacillus macauensis ZFHKF-1 TaxID=1196324 RepID=I8IW17_9BACL|nr:SLAP domain-containing protein [Fictibacillus macauensis]EIT83676.1 hypothetical protein A374_19190 [Fictibacillus macauensis ZFHKF-1]
MQRLMFEQKWDQTISEQDRALITNLFEQSKHEEGAPVKFTFVRSALNHKGDLLVMCLLHHFGGETLTFSEQELTYYEKGSAVAQSVFTITHTALPPHTSMPWTFIFPKQTVMKQPTLAHGELRL